MWGRKRFRGGYSRGRTIVRNIFKGGRRGGRRGMSPAKARKMVAWTLIGALIFLACAPKVRFAVFDFIAKHFPKWVA